ncbi:universal stress protein, partial [candidate division KSB1 bacterium]
PLHLSNKVLKDLEVKKIKKSIDSDLKNRLKTECSVLKDNEILYLNKSVWSSSVIESIKNYAEKNKIDLIVIGTHGRSQLSKMLLGSVAEKIIKYTSVPVITIKKDIISMENNKSISCILAAHDLSANSTEAIKTASKLSDLFISAFHVIHVIPEVPNTYLSSYGLMSEDSEELKVEIFFKTIHSKFRSLVISKISDRQKLKANILTGKPSNKIVEYAKNNNVDLIVIGGRGHGKADEHLLGSTADRVIRKAQCPVLVV